MARPYEKQIENVEKNRKLIFDAEDFLWRHPETGYKEWETQKYLAAQYEKLGYKLTFAGDIPGFYMELDTGREGPTLLMMAEMDALVVGSHPDCDPKTQAVHACGHCAQSAILLGAAAALRENGALDGMCGKIRFMEVPAEEAIEIEYREQLRQKGTIRYFGGKQEFISRGYMDGVDLNTLIHTSVRPAGTADCTAGSNGFVLKTYTFKGKSVHAASPAGGVNALYAATQALSNINALRETFQESECIRVHPIITKGGTVVNAIPEEVTVESYVRGKTVEAILRENEKVNRAAAAAALGMGANLVYADRPGYLPQKNDPAMCAMALEAMDEVLGEGKGKIIQKWGTGSSDMGDMTALFPTAYMHIGGATGHGHGNDYRVDDVESVCVGGAKILAVFARMLLENGAEKAKKVIAGFTPIFKDRAEYCAVMDQMMLDGEAITYNDDGTASVRYKN